jgi:hypothetical protein
MSDHIDNSFPPNPARLTDGQLEELRQQGNWRESHFVEYQTRQLQNLKESVDRLAKPHRLLWWTFGVAGLTLIVCVIGYLDQIARLFRALRFWH